MSDVTTAGMVTDIFSFSLISTLNVKRHFLMEYFHVISYQDIKASLYSYSMHTEISTALLSKDFVSIFNKLIFSPMNLEMILLLLSM